jgi:superfamily II DNA/RNA helicase
VHRIGRTGRAGATGIAISFASGREMDSLYQIERYIGQNIPQHVIPGLEPARPLRRSSNGSSSGPGPSSGKRWQGASTGRRYGQNAASKNSFGPKTGRRPDTDSRFNRDEKKYVKSDGGKFSDFRSAKPGRQSRWA